MTLIEIVVVVAIIGLLMAAVGISVVQTFGEARVDTAKADLVTLGNALKMYGLKRGGLPTTAEGWRPVVEAGVLERVPVDPWGQPYGYRLEGGVAQVWSYGEDRLPSTADDVVARR